MEWLVFASLATALWAVVITIDKVILTEYIPRPVVLVGLMGLLNLTVAGITVGTGQTHVVAFIPGVLSFLQGALYIGAALLYFKALSLEAMTRVAPVFQTIPLMTVLLSTVFLSEILGLLQYGGIVLVLTGTIMISARRDADGMFRLTQAFWLTFAASWLSAITWVLSRYVLYSISYWDLFFWARVGSVVTALGLLATLSSRRQHLDTLRAVPRKAIALFALSEMLSLIALFLSRIALSQGMASIVSTITATHPFFVFAYAIIITRYFPSVPGLDAEQRSPGVKLVACVVILLGVYLITQQRM